LASAAVSVVASMFNAAARMLRWTGYREPIRANYCHLHRQYRLNLMANR
jgi:hypothetical protein